MDTGGWVCLGIPVRRYKYNNNNKVKKESVVKLIGGNCSQFLLLKLYTYTIKKKSLRNA